jgi:glycosyltransferase involved in cell wall biosynthesis
VAERFGVVCDVVPFGVDLDFFAPSDRPADRLESPTRAVRFAYVKWLKPTYGPDVLLNALARIDRGVRWQAVLAGDGPLAAPLRQQAKALGITERVRFAGQLSHAGVAELLRESDIFVMPSREESFGVAAAEASACGLPVVSTAVGGVPEVVLDGETGLLVAPDDADALAAALTLLACDPDLRRRLGAAGRAYVARRYVWDLCVNQMEDIYAEVVGSAKPLRDARLEART